MLSGVKFPRKVHEDLPGRPHRIAGFARSTRRASGTYNFQRLAKNAIRFDAAPTNDLSY